MAHDLGESEMERHGRAIRSAFHSARLTTSQHDRHRARLAENYDRSSSSRVLRVAGGVVAVSMIVLVATLTIVLWRGLTAGSDHDGDDAAILSDSRTPTAAPTETDASTAPTPSPTSVEIAVGYDVATGVCLPSPLSSFRPGDPDQATFTDTWYGDDPDGLWAGLGLENEGVWTTSNRVLWWRFNPIPIEVSGHRLDANAPPLEADLIEGYEGFSHHISSISFPEPGCWQIEASAGDMQLRFVVSVVPFDESPVGLRVQAEKDDIARIREATRPHLIPESCSTSSWSGPATGAAGQYPAELTNGASWQYSYYLAGDGLTLNSRLGLLFAGVNRVFWISDTGALPEDTMITASKIDGGGELAALAFDGPENDVVVQTGENTFVTVRGMDLSLPSPGCWTLTLEDEDVSFTNTVYAFPGHAALNHDRLYVVGQNGRVQTIDLESGLKLFEFSGGIDMDAALSPDGSRLYLASIDSLVAIDALSGTELWRVPIEDRIGWIAGIGPSTLAVSPDGSQVFVYSNSGQIFSAEDGSLVGETRGQSGNCPAEMRLSPDGRTLYLVCIRFGNLRIVDLETGEWIDSIVGQFSGSTVSPDGTRLYAVTTSKRLITIDMNSREVLSDIEIDLPAPPALLMQMVTISPDGSRLYVGLGRDNDDGDAGSQDVREIAVVDPTNGATLDIIETDFLIDWQGLEVDRNGNLYMLSAGRIMRLTGDEAEVVPVVAGTDELQLLVASAGS